MFKRQKNVNCYNGVRPLANISHLPDPILFALESTFTANAFTCFFYPVYPGFFVKECVQNTPWNKSIRSDRLLSERMFVTRTETMNSVTGHSCIVDKTKRKKKNEVSASLPIYLEGYFFGRTISIV
jgi:hypothetical protein